MEIKEILQKWSQSSHPVGNRFYNWENMISFAKHYKQQSEKITNEIGSCDHDYVFARNIQLKDGYLCVHCNDYKLGKK